MDYQTIYANTFRNLGNRTEIEPFMNGWINNAYLYLVTAAKFPEAKRFEPIPCPELDVFTSIYTTDSDPDYVYPTGCLFPVSMRNETSGWVLRARDIRWYNRSKSTTNQAPSSYVPYGKMFYLDPCPDGIYHIKLWYRASVDVPVLVNAVDIPVLGKEWHEAIEIGATLRGLRSSKDPALTTWETAFKQFIIDHSEQYSEEDADFEGGFRIRM